MSRPKAYEPEQDQQYQILCRNLLYSREWEHCDYAKDRQERNYLRYEYRMAYGAGWEFKSILLPRKYWPKKDWAKIHDENKAALLKLYLIR